MSRINDVQKMAAEKEYNKLKREKPWAYVVAALMFAALGFAIIFADAPNKPIYVIVIPWVLFGLCIYQINNRKNRLKYLKEIFENNERHTLCPFCKSENIGLDMVNTGSTTSMGVTRISNNINPLHPFTHTNVRPGRTDTREYYGTIYYCHSCGKTFNEPEIIYK